MAASAAKINKFDSSYAKIMTLIQQLVKKGLLEKEKASSLEYEVKNSGKKEEEAILEQRIVSEDFLFGLKSENLKIPFKRIYP